VRVWGFGKPPQKWGKVDFIQADEPAAEILARAFESENTTRPSLQAGEPGREVRGQKIHRLYSFNPYLVQSIRCASIF